jgi:hypothetical protein
VHKCCFFRIIDGLFFFRGASGPIASLPRLSLFCLRVQKLKEVPSLEPGDLAEESLSLLLAVLGDEVLGDINAVN